MTTMKYEVKLFKTNRFIFKLSVAMMFCLVVFSCSDDKIIPEPSDCDPNEQVIYSGEVEMIIESKCNDIDCHGAVERLLFPDYQGLKSSLESGLFESVVLLREGNPMPPNDRTQLTENELKILNCWKENNFAEN